MPCKQLLSKPAHGLSSQNQSGDLTLMSPKCNFPDKGLIPCCNGEYWPKYNTGLFMFDGL